jgi:hypothetical protein
MAYGFSLVCPPFEMLPNISTEFSTKCLRLSSSRDVEILIEIELLQPFLSSHIASEE